MSSRLSCLLLVAAGTLHLALTWVELEFWRCPLHSATGLDCPGCGLSRSAVASVRGDWSGVLEHHLFGPLAVGAMVLLLLLLGLPAAWRRGFFRTVDTLERRMRLSVVFTVALLAYWGVRVLS